MYYWNTIKHWQTQDDFIILPNEYLFSVIIGYFIHESETNVMQIHKFELWIMVINKLMSSRMSLHQINQF